MQLLRDGAIINYQKTTAGQTTTGFMDNNHDLLFKMVKTDGKLIKVILENNGFV